MSLSARATDRLFERLAATYGAAWTRQWADVPMADVKALWAHELGSFAGCLHRIAWALENLPARCPNAVDFKHLCRQAPAPAVPQLPEPEADPERLRHELSKLGQLRAPPLGAVDHKAWARRIIARHEYGERLAPITLRFAREALGAV